MKNLLSQNILIRTLSRLYRAFPASFRKKSIGVMFSQTLSSFLEIFGLATLLPVFSVIMEENAIEDREYLRVVYHTLGFQDKTQFVIALCAVIIAMIVAKNIINLCIKYFEANFSFSLYQHFSGQLQRYYYQKGFLFLKDQNSNELVRDVNEVTMRFGRNLVLPVLNFLNEIFVTILILAALLAYSPQSVLLIIAIILPTFLIFYRIVRTRLQKLQLDFHALKAELTKSLFESIFGYVDVQINNREEYFFNQYEKQVEKSKKIQTWLYVLNQTPLRVIETTMVLGILALVLYGLTYMEDKGSLTLLLGLLVLAAYRILPSVNRMLVALLEIKGNEYTIGIMEQVKSLQPKVAETTSPISFEREIQFNQLSFSYQGRPEKVLDELSFRVKKGEAIGLIGKSGSGKTTFANILLRFLKETRGEIRVDDTPLTGDNTQAWRQLLGYVQQEVFLIDGTLAENICFGHSEVDENRIYEVLRQASLTEVVAKLPKGIYTRIGERGAQLSGGQRQRVGIARALYSGAQILVFDEATSALDSDTETEITEAIQQLSAENLTMFIIAHRVTTLKYCDRIIELDKGKINKMHSYKDLIVSHL